MKTDVKILLTLLVGLIVVFATTLLFELDWINAMVVRQVLVYALIALEIFLFFNNVRALVRGAGKKVE